jgi:branched-chain amino acid transport system substrate-binding protein
MRQQFLLIFILLSFLLDPHKVFSDDLKIGVILGFTGYANVWSDYSRKGLELAVSEANNKMGPNRTLKLIYEDSQSTASGSVSSYQKLVHQDKVDIVIGDVWAFLTIPLIPLAARDKIVLISPTVMDGSIPDTNEYYFSMGHRFESLHEPMQKFFILNSGIKKAAAISFNDTWNNAFLNVFNKVAQEKGVETIKDIKVNDFNPDFRTEMTAIKRLKPDMLLTTWKPEIALRRMKDQRLQVPYLCSSDAVEAVLFRSKEKALFEGMYFIDWKPSDEFIHKFKARYGTAPLYEAQNSYEVIRAISKAQESGPSDIRQALSQVSYDGVEGKVDFRVSRFPNMGQARLYRVKNGTFVEE